MVVSDLLKRFRRFGEAERNHFNYYPETRDEVNSEGHSQTLTIIWLMIRNGQWCAPGHYDEDTLITLWVRMWRIIMVIGAGPVLHVLIRVPSIVTTFVFRWMLTSLVQ